MHTFLQPLRLAALATAAAALAACGGHGHDHDHDHDGEEHTEEGHAHEAPHDGALVELGDHFANVEVLFDADTGTLTVYGLGAHAVKSERAPEESLAVTVAPDDGDAVELSLAPEVSELNGNKVGDSSIFSAQSDALKGWGHFHGKIAKITLLGTSFEDIDFAWPPGDHHHDEDGDDHGEDHDEDSH